MYSCRSLRLSLRPPSRDCLGPDQDFASIDNALCQPTGSCLLLTALLSDIHGNLEALNACLHHARSRGAERSEAQRGRSRPLTS